MDHAWIRIECEISTKETCMWILISSMSRLLSVRGLRGPNSGLPDPYIRTPALFVLYHLRDMEGIRTCLKLLGAGALRVLQPLVPIAIAIARDPKAPSGHEGHGAQDEEMVLLTHHEADYAGRRATREQESGELEGLRRALQETSETLEQERHRANQLEAERNKLVHAMKDGINRMEAELSERDHRYQELEAGYHALEKRLEDQRQLLEARSAELRVAQTFLTKTDTISVTDVKTMVTDLNTDIFQAAVMLADMLNFRQRTKYGVAESKHAQGRVKAWLEPDFARALSGANDSSILQIAVRGVICHHCNLIINSWPSQVSEGGVRSREEYKTLYSSMIGSGEHIVFINRDNG
ncbi:hypothetical protein OE88DRAFT_191837 [Heliocybe sulcata]|uniref:Uncharacterized protein n=1 Tax=Heliocybe sulcata TaxID=5364 RepID=A0A5C3MZJ3_9AGAM|nr:hypothetical protein OE88DRAFT_191837 [Heliocybe sulcata]